MAKASLISRIKLNARGRASNAASTLALVLESVDVLKAHGDWTPLAWIVSLASGSDRTRLSAIISTVCGVTFRVDNAQPSGLRAIMPKPEEAAVEGSNGDMLGILSMYVAFGSGFRDKALETGIENKDVKIPALIPRDVKEYDVAAVDRAVLKALAEGYESDVILARVKAVLKNANADKKAA